MARIVVAAADDAMRRAIAAALAGTGLPLVAARGRHDADALLDGAGVRQVVVCFPGRGDDLRWAAGMLERHPGLRVVCLGAGPWASLDYGRARCVVGPHSPEALDAGLLRRMVLDLLA